MTLRYVINFDTNSIESQEYDVAIIGSGIAGLYSAVNLDSSLRVCILSKESMDENNSYLAQGGIAAAVGDDDLPSYHLEDTLTAGAGHCNREAVSVLVEEAPRDIKRLCDMGTNFDRNEDGTLTTTREGGHRRFRIVHALGDATGKEVVDSLLRECRRRSNIKIFENCFAADILTDGNSCIGVLAISEDRYTAFYAQKVICASGGIGQVYKNTTNPEVATGDGIAMAYRAGAVLSDMEFVQFHPTAFYNPSDSGNSFLISEAVRGEGGILKNINGERFMANYHELGEVAPRDIVSRAIFSEMRRTGSKHVYLDITHQDGDYLRKRFPTIYGRCLEAGIDITRDYIPVCPVQHYFMGGIKTDLWGRTSIDSLYSCGETANTGVHGANRLASNSLLEGLVFGRRSAEDINAYFAKAGKDSAATGKVHIVNRLRTGDNGSAASVDAHEVEQIRESIKLLMDAHAGIERNERDMKQALEEIYGMIQELENVDVVNIRTIETLNIAYLASQILEGAIARKQSCGSHYRVD